MATRTVKFLGKAYSDSGDVSLTVSVNGTQVHTGTVTTKASTGTENTDELYEMFTFNLDTSVTGWLPVSVAVSGGTAYFGILEGNYVGSEATFDDDGEVISVEVAPEDYFGDMNINTEESDGKRNIAIDPADGDIPTRTIVDDGQAVGDWHYAIQDGATLTCEYYVDPDLVVTEVS